MGSRFAQQNRMFWRRRSEKIIRAIRLIRGRRPLTALLQFGSDVFPLGIDAIDKRHMTMLLVIMTITATEFKAKCLQLMETVQATQEPIIILKRGKEVARLVPPVSKKKPWQELKGTVEILGDIVSPVFSDKEISGFNASTGKELAHGRRSH